MALDSRRLLPALLLVSGFCGISYEILYTKLLGNLLGNQFTISASVLLTFLLGIGMGTLYAHRLVRRLWVIEAGIGVYAAGMVVSYGWIDRLLYAQVPEMGTSLLACALVSVVLLIVPAFLVGCSVPIFAAYLGTLRSSNVFSLTYGIYNFGAALTALTMEFALLRVVGLRTATLLLALLNGVVAVALLALVRTTPIVPAPVSGSRSFAARDLSALALASVASAVFQLLMIKVAECIFGPYNETFSLVLATVLLGLGVGSLVVGRYRLGFSGALLLGLGGVAALLAAIGPATSLYAALYPSVVKTYPLLVLLKLALVLTLMGLPAVGFGATIPALLRTHRDVARESGRLLFVSSMGNVAGFVLMAFVLHRLLDYGPLLLIVAAITAVALLIHGGPRARPVWAGAALLAVAAGAQFGVWNEMLLYYGHANFHSTRDLQQARESSITADERFRGHQDVFAITRKDDKAYFFINGYISIILSNSSEKIVGGLSTMLAPRTDRALVLGIGSGATAGTVGLLFDDVDAVEINPVVLENLWRMKEYNFDIESRPNVHIFNDDGIHFVKTTPERYSLILNTVTTPLYFSSSKLYTTDFLEAVAAKLTPDGVYTTWIDRKIGDRGVDIILNTLNRVFDRCWMTYLKSSYYLLACSNDDIQLRQIATVTGNPTLRDYLAEDHALPIELLPYSVLSVDALGLVADPQAPRNTLDFPVLEHEMARLDSEVRLLEFRERLARRLDLRAVQRELSAVMDWDPAAFALWSEMRLTSRSTLYQVLSLVIPRQFGDLSTGFARVALETAESVGTARGWYKAGHELFKRELIPPAIEAFERCVRLDPETYRAYYYLGRSHEGLEQMDLARGYYREALRHRPDYDAAQEALERLGSALEAADPGGPASEDDPEDDEEERD